MHIDYARSVPGRDLVESLITDTVSSLRSCALHPLFEMFLGLADGFGWVLLFLPVACYSLLFGKNAALEFISLCEIGAKNTLKMYL